MRLLEELVFRFAFEERFGVVLALGEANFVEVLERFERAFSPVAAFFVREHAADGKRCPVGDEDFGMFRSDGLLVGNAEAFLESADEGRVERERSAFEDDGRLDFHALREAADCLLCDGVEARKGDVFLGDAAVEHRLDVCFGKDSAASRNFVNLRTAGGERFELFRLDAEKSRYLVDERSGSAGAYAVHAHVACDELSCSLVLFEEDDFCVLSAEFDGDTGFGMGRSHGESVGDDFLDKECVCRVGEWLRTGTAECHPEILVGEHPVGGRKDFIDFLCLHRVVTFVGKMEKLFGCRIDDGNFHGSRTDIDTNPQVFVLNAHSVANLEKSDVF